MSPTAKFNSLLASATVFVMYFVITYVGPVLKSAGTYHPILVPIGALLTSLGVYRLFAVLLRWLIGEFECIRALVLGAYYLNGTWVGWFRGHKNDFRYMVEHFEQDLDSLVIRGWSYMPDKKSHGDWHSTTASIDAETAKLRFTYCFNVYTQNKPVYGLNESLLQRESKRKASFGLKGLAHDLNDETRIPVQSIKVSSQLLKLDDALAIAVERFHCENPNPSIELTSNGLRSSTTAHVER